MPMMKRLAMPALATLALYACGGGGGAGLVPEPLAVPEQTWSTGAPSCTSVGCIYELHYERFRRLGDCSRRSAASWCPVLWPDGARPGP